MPWTNQHISWLVDTGQTITLSCGAQAKVYSFNHDANSQAIMRAWAKHFRNHYCSDIHLPILKPNNMTKAEYLLELKFPSKTGGSGPATRSGDFAEILVADYLTYLHGYMVPRTRYDRKTITNESTKGSDVIAFKNVSDKPTRSDEMLIYEVKAKLTGNSTASRLQDAIDDSTKDEVRIAESLNAIKQRLFDLGDVESMNKVGRFQSGEDHPYQRKYGAATVLTDSAFDQTILATSSTKEHPAGDDLSLLVIRGEDFMKLVHALYERAANEA